MVRRRIARVIVTGPTIRFRPKMMGADAAGYIGCPEAEGIDVTVDRVGGLLGVGVDLSVHQDPRPSPRTIA